jgi:ubiquinone/menaquinone biosynthesis C-methylase UbiE
LNFIADIIQTYCKPGATILDIGCGNGNMARGVGSLGYAVHGIDFSEAAIGYAKSKNTLPNVQFSVQRAEDLAATQHFDAVICSEVLEHLQHPSLLMETISRILKPAGVLVATVPNGKGPRELLVTRPVQALSKTWMGKVIGTSKKILGYADATVQSQSEDLTHIQFFSRSAFSSLIGSAGFDLLRFRHSNSMEKVFPYSMLTKRVRVLSKIDNAIADYLPSALTSGFNTAWIRKA